MIRLMALLLLTIPVSAKPIVIYGNSYGVWAQGEPPKGPPETSIAREKSPVFTSPPETITIATETPTVCPTLKSSPHLCNPNVQ